MNTSALPVSTLPLHPRIAWARSLLARATSRSPLLGGRRAHVGQIMSRGPRTCGPDDSLSRAAQAMWESDCGCVPVVDAGGKAIAMITDRDVCMAAFTQAKPLSQIPVSVAASRTIATVHEDDTVEAAEAVMRANRIRRVPVVDAGGRVTGVLSVNDLVRHLGHRRRDLDDLVGTVATICEPTAHPAAASA